MMKQPKQTSHRPITACVYALALCLLCLVLGSLQSAQAQWTTPDVNNNIHNNNTGNVGVGIGTGSATPGAKLDVGAGAAARGSHTDLLIGSGGDVPQLEFFGGSKSSAIAHDDAGGLTFWTGGPSWLSAFFIGHNGYVGIGTTTPQSQFHLNSGAQTSLLVSGQGASVVSIQDLNATTDQKIYQLRSEGGLFRLRLINDQWTTPIQQNLIVANSAGNVGIGTDTPGRKLEVLATDGEAMRLYRNAATAGWGVNIKFAFNNSNNSEIDYAGVHGQIAGSTAGAENGNLLFSTVTTGNLTEKMRIDSAGHVGIGTTTPTKALDVFGDVNVGGSGNLTISGTINAKYQDVAEWVPSSQQLTAGTVVTLDPTKTNQVQASTHAYDTSVAGVVSAQPGLMLGQGGAGKVLVATTGRVRVKVDATKAPIHVGDLLVTSDTAGVAMRSVPVELGGVQLHRPGTLIGKALEPLESGKGEILVLLSLQ